ncbi:MAG: hypothetical protein KAV44_07010 [Bacteroidales bacterium]|nr:hypothetical protein [Bacteroidales bacterium]
MENFQNKYRTQSNRMPCWDYSGKGAYFITICVNNRDCIFGHVEQDEMILNDFGKIAHHEWKISAQIRNEIELDAFVIMPNHIHGIVIIYKSNLDNNIHNTNHDTHGLHGLHVETHGRASLQKQQKQPQQPNQPKLYRKPKSISSFIAGYKSSVTTKINNLIEKHVNTHGRAYQQNGRAFQLVTQKFNRKNRLWQVNYNDHIIRNDTEYNRTKTYIIENPKKWHQDKFYK